MNINRLFDRATAWLKGWRTIFINVLASIVPILELTEVRDVMPDEWLQWYALALVLINMYLRWRTTSPVGKKL